MIPFHTISSILKAWYKKHEAIHAVVILMNTNLVSYEKGMELIKEFKKVSIWR